jgi:excisionase family DNA binding protein
MDKTILVAQEVADILRIGKQRVYELVRRRKIPGVIYLGDRQYRFSASAIEKFAAGQNVTWEEKENNEN